MIALNQLTVEFTAQALFEDVSFVINDNDKIALVGKNGAGKSTLLKILCGQQQPSSGSVSVSNGTTIGYLPQVMKLSDDTTVREEVKKAFGSLLQIKRDLKLMQEELALRTDYESEEYHQLIDRFTTENERYSMLGGDQYEAEMERTLRGLGFGQGDFERATSEFSGGWRMRIELAKLLLQHPDVLLLDEPTNHLDIESIQWLEQFLSQGCKAVVLVSHDRAFINHVTNRTIEITCRHIEDYAVKYDEYLVLRAERREQQLRAYANQQKEIAESRDFIERFRYKPSKAVQVQQRIRQLEKMQIVEVDEQDTTSMRLRFPPCLRSGDFPIICDEVAKNYGEHQVFSQVNLSIKRGDKVAFVGKNGEGKSTLVKCIMGEIPFEGNLKVGHNVQIGYFAQNQAQLLDENITIYDTIDQVAKGDMRLRINDLLGAFMFGGEKSEKKVKVLSGGERSRLAMIKLLLEPVNLLILDEPTNHLDLASKDVLKEAIRQFDGTAIIVSHDRDFLDGLVDKVYEFSGGKVREHLGGIYDYLAAHQAQTIQEVVSRTQEVKCTPSPEKSPAKQSYADHKEQQKLLRKAQKEVDECEKRISKQEERLAELDTLLAQPEHASNMELVHEYSEISKTLEQDNALWLELSERLEQMKH